MAIIKCKMCGGDLDIVDGQSVAECEYCGSRQTVPSADNEKKLTLFARANRLRLACEFDKAAGIYEAIVADFPEEAEAYWGLVLCKFGIEYVDDPATGKKIPTCHRSSFESIMEDSDYEQALENADAVARKVYREEAKQIEEIRKGIIAVSANEEPYDIFICYKETDPSGDRTLDSVLAQDIYDALTDKGYRVFFSRITLEDKLGVEYEPYIFAALNSAKIMLAVGTDYEYYNAVWVKNEWSRYLKLMAKDRSKHLIPCFKNLDAYDMPKEFARLQAQDLGKMGAIQDILRGVEKILPKQRPEQSVKETVVVRESVQSAGPSMDSLLKRAFMFLADSDWKSASEYCERVLDIDPECAKAYLGKCCAFYQNADIHQIIPAWGAKLLENNDLKNALRFMDSSDAAKLQEEINAAEQKIQEVKRRQEQEQEADRIAKAKAAREKREAEYRKKTAELAPKRERIQKAVGSVGAGWFHTVVLNSDGTVTAIGGNDKGQCNVSGWTDCIAVGAWGDNTVALKSDGTVLATGDNAYGQCNVSKWSECTAVAPGSRHTVALKADGTVMAVGSNEYGQCDVSGWTDCIAIAAGVFHTVGLKADGRVLATGKNEDGQCGVQYWSNCVAIAAGASHTAALKTDGTVVAVGSNKRGQLNVDRWKDCVGIAAGYFSTFGIETLAEVVKTSKDNGWGSRLTDWRNCVAIASGYDHTIALTGEGKLLAKWENNSYQQCNVHNWRLFRNIDTVDEERRNAKLARQYRVAGKCQHCGGEFKGLFGKKCSKCGKPKDY